MDTGRTMAQENVEILREVYRQVNEGGFAAIADFVAPGFTMDSPQAVEASQARDKAGLREWFGKMDEIWERLSFEPTEIVAVDDERALAVVHTSGRAKGSGIEIAQELTHLWTLRDALAVRLETYSTKGEALDAVSE